MLIWIRVPQLMNWVSFEELSFNVVVRDRLLFLFIEFLDLDFVAESTKFWLNTIII